MAVARISLSADPQGCLVFVVDDLYESGATLRCFAEELKARGAREVRGLVCAKALRDTDNQ
jgi:predicted amidophosphoribosyltransferase